jgi:hypothetical protein
MSKIYVYSTLTNDQVYANYKQGPNGISVPTEEVFIAGKANLANKHFITPRGMVTEVTAEQLSAMRQNEVFRIHEKNGFILVSESKCEVEKVASDMQGRDQSAPLVAQDFGDDEAPVTNTDPESAPRRGRHRKAD